jgi:hypothetical protein
MTFFASIPCVTALNKLKRLPRAVFGLVDFLAFFRFPCPLEVWRSL